MYDVAIIGGGIVGLAVALAISERYPAARLVVLEKEAGWAAHQSGRNSGVIHSGVYYKPGSFKARFAHDGNRSMRRFCEQHGIAHEICGKVIVATTPRELPLLERLYERGHANGLALRRLAPAELREIEPHCAGLAALQVPSTGIVDYRAVAATYARLVAERGGELRLGIAVQALRVGGSGVELDTGGDTVEARFLVNCAGLHSDRIARMAGATVDARIVPFRGEYYELKPERRGLVKHLIYPVPNPDFPFLGVHFTRMIGGDVHAGPNAVLSLKREGYRKRDISLRDARDAITYPGFLRLARANWREGIYEIVRSLSKAAFVRSLQRLIPEVQSDDLVPSTAGVRAQAVLRDGRLVDDFLIVPSPRALHVVNAPSPAATASLEIGRYVAAQLPADLLPS